MAEPNHKRDHSHPAQLPSSGQAPPDFCTSCLTGGTRKGQVKDYGYYGILCDRCYKKVTGHRDQPLTPSWGMSTGRKNKDLNRIY